MAKKKKRPVKEAEGQEVKVRDDSRRTVPKAPAKLSRQQWYIVLGILLITFICFLPALSKEKEFTNWDDPVYVVNYEVRTQPKVQPQIEKLDAEHLKVMFSPSNPVSLNYHPLTMLSLAINYSISKLEPFGYFFTNILFHVLNTLLVFVFLYRLSGKKFWVGALSALLFGIHPMHVESVAWASERKDVLYCFFFLASCITYLSYLETKKLKFFVFCFLLFLLSCLSKAMAIPLTLVLLLIDFYRQRQFTLKVIAEKIPFLALTLIFGLLAVSIQSREAIAEFQVFTLPQRFMFAAYGFMAYWVKLFVPYKLSAFYNYPAMDGVGLIYQAAPFAALLFVFGPMYYFYKKNREHFRTWVFGMGFFIAMVAMVLQFISVGAAIMADRYSYLPYIGAFFIITMLVNDKLENVQARKIMLGIFGTVSLVLAVVCYQRVKVWQNSETLWTDVIEKYPYVIEQTGNVVHVKQLGVDNAYKNRGNYYRERGGPGDMERAFADYELLVKAQTRDIGAYNNMGNFYGVKGQEAQQQKNTQLATQMFNKAIEMYSESIKRKPDPVAYSNRAITWASLGQHQKAIDDLKKALELSPTSLNFLVSLAYEEIQLGKYEETIAHCTQAINGGYNDPNAYFYRGTAYENTGRHNEAIADFLKATQLNPNFAYAWFNLSVAYSKTGNKAQALQAALNAKKSGYAVSDEYLNRLK